MISLRHVPGETRKYCWIFCKHHGIIHKISPSLHNDTGLFFPVDRPIYTATILDKGRHLQYKDLTWMACVSMTITPMWSGWNGQITEDKLP